MFLVRHGKTRGNSKGTYRSWSNDEDAQLTGEGRDGIRESALWFQKSDQHFPLIISDDLDRSQETKKILQDILQIPVAETDKRLRPLNVGDFTGKSKTEHPIEPYTKNPKLVIPGGESINQFDARQAKFFDHVAQIIEKLGPILIVGHGSTVSFLHNHFNKSGGQVGYEGLVNPGGILMFTAKGIEPLTNKREGVASSMVVGTATSGYVTSEENRPPRSCWNCYWFSRDAVDTPLCGNPVVRVDPALAAQRSENGLVVVGEDSCCNMFRNRIGS